MIIDAHVHVGRTEKSKRAFTFAGMKLYMAGTGIDKAVVMPNLSHMVPFSELNEKFLVEAGKYSEQFYPFILIDPFDSETLSQAKTMNVFGLKYHPSFCQCEVDNERLYPVFEIAGERGLPVLVHCGRNEKSDMKYLVHAAEDHPGVQFIAAHLGGNATELAEAAIDLLYRRGDIKNISLDTSNGKLPWLVTLAVDKLGAERVVFGSDEPYASIVIEKMCVELADLTDQEKELIFSGNIRRILHVR